MPLLSLVVINMLLPGSNRCSLFVVPLCLAMLAGVLSTTAWSAEKAKVDDAIKRGQTYLLQQPKIGAEGSLTCYALIKSGIDKQHPDVVKQVQDVVAKCRTTGYQPGLQHIYEAGVDAMLLEAVDPVANKPQLQLIANFLISRQLACGGWYYPHEERLNQGDTSITQYAVLGLWAASRAGVEVPIEVWEKTAQWLMKSQCPDGGFAYHPTDGLKSTITMTAAGTGSLLIIRRELFGGGGEVSDPVRPGGPAPAGRRFGVLEQAADEPMTKPEAPKVKTVSTLSKSSVDKVIKEGVQWTTAHFGDRSSEWVCYYFYGIERVAALLGTDKIGTHNWYDDGAAELLTRQLPDGSWNDQSRAIPSTALAILFLTKATSTILPKPKRVALVGGGLLAGGRGLPENLDAVQVKDGQVAARKLQGPVDGLLADLEKSSDDVRVEAVQAAVVEAVQLDRPEELIGQVDRLKKLATDPRVEVRRTAMWALGRTGSISVAPLLIRGLTDANEEVLREASLGLCILSRKPDGCGLPVDPTDGLKEDATEDERRRHLEKWGKESNNLWQKWYFKVRPYGERDDRTLLKRKS